MPWQFDISQETMLLFIQLLSELFFFFLTGKDIQVCTSSVYATILRWKMNALRLIREPFEWFNSTLFYPQAKWPWGCFYGRARRGRTCVVACVKRVKQLSLLQKMNIRSFLWCRSDAMLLGYYERINSRPPKERQFTHIQDFVKFILIQKDLDDVKGMDKFYSGPNVSPLGIP